MDAKTYTELKKRVERIRHKKIEMTKEIQMLREQRDEVISSLRELGIEDTANLPQLLETWKQELEAEEQQVTKRIEQIESMLGA